MALDNDVVDEEVDSNETDTSNDEPQSSAPEAGSFNRESFVADTYAEGAEEAVIDTLAAKADITLDDLRTIPGAENMTDAQLTAAWNKAQGEAGNKVNADGTPAAETPVELPFPVYDAQGNKLEAGKVTLDDLLSGKAQIGYNAMGKEQRKALSDVIRNASQGHWNEHRYNTVQGQYRESTQRVQQLEKEAASFNEQQQQWNAALTALVMGNNAPMRAMVEAYKGAMGKTGITPEGYVSRETADQQLAAERQGMEVYQTVIVPAAQDIASRYGAKFDEVDNAIKYFVNNEPNLTKERFDEILKYDVPMAFEAQGYTASGSNPTGGPQGQGNGTDNSNNEVAELKKQLAALSARFAGNANERTDAVRAKARKSPPAGSGVTGGAGDSMPSFKSRAEMKEYLQS